MGQEEEPTPLAEPPLLLSPKGWAAGSPARIKSEVLSGFLAKIIPLGEAGMFASEEWMAGSPASPSPGVAGRFGSAPGQSISRRKEEGKEKAGKARRLLQPRRWGGRERSASPREGRGSFFCFYRCFSFNLRSPFPSPSPYTPVCPGPHRLSRQGTGSKQILFIPFLYWLLYF